MNVAKPLALAALAALAGWLWWPAPAVPRPAAPASLPVANQPARACHLFALEPMRVKCPTAGGTVLWGDSMAYGWSPAARKAHPDIQQFTMDSCGPFLNLPGTLPGNIKCRKWARVAAEAARRADTVFLVGKWYDYRLDDFGDTLALVAPHAKRVVVIGPTPMLPESAPECVAYRHDCTLSRSAFDARAKPILAKLRELAARHPNVTVVGVGDRFCSATECQPSRDGRLLYADAYHLTSDATAGQSDLFR